METNIRARKLVAALVLGAFMVMLIAFWGNSRAGERARSSEVECLALRAGSGLSLKLGLATTADEMLKILGPSETVEKDAAACRREIFKAQVEADSAVVVGCSLLLSAFFLFVGSQRSSPWWSYVLLGAGLVVSAVFAYGDSSENRELLRAIHAASLDSSVLMPEPEQLRLFLFVKLGALAVAALILGVLWISRSESRWVYLPKAFALLAGLVLALAIYARYEYGALVGMALVACWWISGLTHAIFVAASREPV